MGPYRLTVLDDSSFTVIGSHIYYFRDFAVVSHA
jgi:hypothetical protein